MKLVPFVAALLAVIVLSGCSGLGQMLRVPTGPNAPVKMLSAKQAEDVVAFRGLSAGECADVAGELSGSSSFIAGCLLPVAVGGDVTLRMVFCARPGHYAQCKEWGSKAFRKEISFLGPPPDFAAGAVFVPSSKDQLKGRDI